MDAYRILFEISLKQMHQLADKMTEEMDTLPDGTLIKRTDSDSYWLQYKEDGRFKRVYLPKDSRLINELARKELLRRTIPIINENIRNLDIFIQKYMEYDAQTIIQKMAKSYRSLPYECFAEINKPLF